MTAITETKAGDLGSGGTLALAEWISELELGALPDEVVHEGKRALLDHLAVALAGANEESTNNMVSVLSETAGRGDAALIGRTEKLPSPFAAHHLPRQRACVAGDLGAGGQARDQRRARARRIRRGL
jgi:hypothetical protein